jgi:error-prone DNA polymerase
MVDLHTHSYYSFLDGASSPQELVDRAVELGYSALALTDHDGVYGSLEFAAVAKERGLQAITGAEVTLEDGSHLTLLSENSTGYANLCRLLSTAHRECERRHPRLRYDALAEHAAGLIALSGCALGRVPQLLQAGQVREAERLAAQFLEWFGNGYFLEIQQNLVWDDAERSVALAALGQRLRIPVVGTNNTHYHVRARYRLQDALVAIRHGKTLDEVENLCRPNSEFALKHPRTLKDRFRAFPAALENALAIAVRCRSFDILTDLGYRFPDFQREGEAVELTAPAALRLLCEQALREKYGSESAERQREAREWLERELRLVDLHGLAGFFLVYKDLLQLGREVAAELRAGTARGQFDLPAGRGRGSAVSSILCYLIGLSGVDPIRAKLFPGRFLNESLTSVPDIDLDFGRDIREELIRRVHERYGADHVGMVCTFQTYQFKGTVHDLGEALGLPTEELKRLAKLGDNHAPIATEMERLAEFQGYGSSYRWRLLHELGGQIEGFPRHLSQHVGGVVISSRPLVELVPIQNSAMAGRQLVQWDKDGCEIARFIKVDFLALGMLSAVEETLELIVANGKPPVDLSRINFQDRRIYARLGRGDTVGAFQVESRGQIGMIVRTRPENMDQLAIQVAIVRPGPVVAGSARWYVQRREQQRYGRLSRVPYDHPLLEPVLRDTLGVMIFQDQVMVVAMALAGFNDGEADQLRRAMSRKRSQANIELFRARFLAGAAERGVPEATAEKVFQQILGFAGYGFPKSHACAFAVLAYQSTWLLHYYPTEFFCALLNNQPMGFYGKDTLIKEAARRGIRVFPPDLNQSELRCTVRGRTIRLGLLQVQGIGEANATRVVEEREAGGVYLSPLDFVRRTRLPERVTEAMILAGAWDTLAGNRRELLWQAWLAAKQRGRQFMEATPNGTQPVAYQPTLPLPTEHDHVPLTAPGRWERMAQEYRLLHMSLEGHPLRLLRPLLPAEVCSIRDARRATNGSRIYVGGLVTTRQRPETAGGILFLLLEDETGLLNVVVLKERFEAQRELFRVESLLLIRGTMQRRDRQRDFVAEKCWPLRVALPDAAKSRIGRQAEAAVRDWTPPPTHDFR